jgi:hypothetical protein
MKTSSARFKSLSARLAVTIGLTLSATTAVTAIAAVSASPASAASCSSNSKYAAFASMSFATSSDFSVCGGQSYTMQSASVPSNGCKVGVSVSPTSIPAQISVSYPSSKKRDCQRRWTSRTATCTNGVRARVTAALSGTGIRVNCDNAARVPEPGDAEYCIAFWRRCFEY